MEIQKFKIESKSGLFKTSYHVYDEDQNLCFYSKTISVFKNERVIFSSDDGEIMSIISNAWSTAYKIFSKNEELEQLLAEVKTSMASKVSLKIDSIVGYLELRKPNVFKGHYILCDKDNNEIAAISRKSSGFSYIHGIALKDDQLKELIIGISIIVVILGTNGMI